MGLDEARAALRAKYPELTASANGGRGGRSEEGVSILNAYLETAEWIAKRNEERTCEQWYAKLAKNGQ